eukprot:16288334-Heterocapsa_arctica.AAC.1
MVLLQLAGIHTLFASPGGSIKADALVKAAGLGGNVGRRATMVNWKKGLVSTNPGFQAPGSMCIVEDLCKHQLEKGAKHLQARTIDLLDTLAAGIKATLGDRFKPVDCRKTGARVTAIDPTLGASTPGLPSRRRRNGGDSEDAPTYLSTTAPFENVDARNPDPGATPEHQTGDFLGESSQKLGQLDRIGPPPGLDIPMSTAQAKPAGVMEVDEDAGSGDPTYSTGNAVLPTPIAP